MAVTAFRSHRKLEMGETAMKLILSFVAASVFISALVVLARNNKPETCEPEMEHLGDPSAPIPPHHYLFRG